MKLEIRLFAGLTCKNENLPCFGQHEFRLDAPEGITVKDLYEFLKLGPIPLVSVVNGVVEKKDFILSSQDRVGIFPPIAGGDALQLDSEGPRLLSSFHLFTAQYF